MSEIPKLMIVIPEIDIKQWTKDPKRLWYSIEQIQEINVFYDKYKNNMGLFIKDFPEFKTYWEQREKSLSLCCIKEYLYIELFKEFKDWLHDYLYKVE